MSVMLYDLTASVAQMCAPVPAAATGGWTDWLDHWQTLLGAAVGGFMGVAGAWIVARSHRRRDQDVAAGMVLPDLQQLDAAGQSLRQRLGPPPNAPNLPAQARAFFEAGRVVDTLKLLAERRPKLFALHTPAIGQLSDVDARLYSHLFQCQMVHRQFEDAMESLKAVPSEPKGLDLRHQRICSDSTLCVEHAALARFWLENLVFSPWPRWVVNAYLKRRPDDLVKRSMYLLEKGEIRPPSMTGERGQL
ncbi:hypothetical protein LMG28688_06598 [Paraburkholderia caffeinitolerans]|uniref:Uncharacterized protein n=1 Tax=Paraburkholderia caffeinitolerans TaxID=1723730 RepID=A0A6J5GYJ9_9BURK|nr:hypothetical protein [Paraburkholderia caffeinitolerans]CAB3807663.1 hypothetical protein LMG28688_06598 [Paraburkholderia caffeinitolerans]